MLFCVLGVAHGVTEDTDLWLFKEPQWKLEARKVPYKSWVLQGPRHQEATLQWYR